MLEAMFKRSRWGMQAHGGARQGNAERRSFSTADILPVPEGRENGLQVEHDGADSDENGWYNTLPPAN